MTDHVEEPVGVGAPVMAVLPSPVDLEREAREAIAAQLVEDAAAKGVSLVGPGGLLADLTKRVLELGLEVEMTEHLGYEKHSVDGHRSGNSRNGSRSKTVLTDIGPVGACQ
jgi:putative transposase